MLPIAQPLQSMLDAGIQHFCSCWRIERTDGVTLLFTDHDSALIINSETFMPAGSFNASARQKTSGLNAHNLELVGVLDNAAITHEDLRAGRYREAKITEYIVDWRYPWAGTIMTTVWWLGDSTFEDGQWNAKVEGITRWFGQAVGRVYGRLCDANLGDARCKFNLAPVTISPATVGTVDTSFPRKRFRSAGLIGDPVDYFANGKVTWITGANAGLALEVKSFNNTTGELTLYLSAPFNIVVGDTYSLIPGCDHNLSTCHDRFDNVVNFRGFATIPGTDASLQYPNSKI
jgi:uncharacterized phage protein (TIGR02218 family)